MQILLRPGSAALLAVPRVAHDRPKHLEPHRPLQCLRAAALNPAVEQQSSAGCSPRQLHASAMQRHQQMSQPLLSPRMLNWSLPQPGNCWAASRSDQSHLPGTKGTQRLHSTVAWMEQNPCVLQKPCGWTLRFPLEDCKEKPAPPLSLRPLLRSVQLQLPPFLLSLSAAPLLHPKSPP